MKKKIFTVMIVGLFIASLGIISAAPQETSTAIISVYPKEVSISVPDEILFPNIAPGYISPDVSFNVMNDGTEDISITALIPNGDAIINNNRLFLKKNGVDNLTTSEAFSFEILKPTSVGGTRSEIIFAALDLTSFDGEIPEPMINQTYDLTFTAMALNY